MVQIVASNPPLLNFLQLPSLSSKKKKMTNIQLSNSGSISIARLLSLNTYKYLA